MAFSFLFSYNIFIWFSHLLFMIVVIDARTLNLTSLEGDPEVSLEIIVSPIIVETIQLCEAKSEETL